MTRPSLEETYRTYTEKYWASTGSGTGDYPIDLRDYFRSFSGTKSPLWPRVKAYNNLSVAYSKVNSRKMNELFRFYRLPNSPSDWIFYTYRTPYPFNPPSGIPYQIGMVSHHPDAYGSAISRAMDKVQDRKVNFAQFVAERKQLEDGITDVVKRLTRVIRAVKKPNKNSLKEIRSALKLTSNPKKLSGNVAQDWLALQYGWKPLLADVVGFAEHFAERELDRPKRFKVRAKVKLKQPAFSATNSHLNCSNTVKWQWDESTTDAETILEFVITNDFQRIGSQLGLTDPLTLAWELLPYSFVVDWFLPIGAFLGRLNYDSGLQFLTGATTQFSLQKSWVDVLGGEYHAYDGQVLQLASCSKIVDYKSFLLDRVVHTVPPRAFLPHFKDPFSPTHFANAFALMRVAFKGGPSTSNRYFTAQA